MNAASHFFRACRQRNFPTSTTNASRILQQTQRRPFSAALTTRSQPLTESPASSAAEPSSQTTSTSTPTTTELSTSESDALFLASSFTLTARVTRAGTMSKTVRVTRNVQRFDKKLRKHYTRPESTLVHDPTSLLVEGDVITYGLMPLSERARRVQTGQLRRDKGVRYVLRDVVTPFGTPLDQRGEKGAEMLRDQQQQHSAESGEADKHASEGKKQHRKVAFVE